ncbi:MAG: hypothetical protein IJZ00_06185 [Lachnospiraceae bacterium]|nr:hypothetical protein [Lachnospiraceae bacterium]
MKTILYLNHDFFAYDRAIAKELEKRGYQVLFRKFVRTAGFLDRRLCKKKGIPARQYASECMQKAILKELEKKKVKVDVVLVTSGQALTEETMQRLHEMYPKACFLWNLWDGKKEIGTFSQLSPYFNHLISFDKLEAKQCGFHYMSDFYLQEYPAKEKKYDYCFVATNTEPRYRILQEMLAKANTENVFVYLKETPDQRLIPSLKRLFSGEEKRLAERKIFYNSLEYDTMLEVFASSKCIIDIAHPGQTGLSMRPFEAMAVQSKLVTTNPEIKNYDFYNPNNIFVVQPDEIQMPGRDFLDGAYEAIPEEIYKKYSVESWCDQLQELFS